MSNELRAYLPTGSTLYAVLINSAGQIWNTSGTPAFEAYNGSNWTDYDIAMTEAGAGLYFGDMPAVVAGNYNYVVYEQAGGSPAITDDINGMGTIAWDGSAEIFGLCTATVFPAGAINFTYTVTDSVTTLPIEGVEVWFSTDNPAVNIVWKGDTDAFGVARDVLGNLPALDAGNYFVWRQKAGYTFSDPDSEVVS
jgi:hypothetical protein